MLRLKRLSILPEGAFGVLIPEGGAPIAATLERTYLPDDATVIGVVLHGQKLKIPPGQYFCRRRFFNRGHYWTYEILVPEHSALLFHKGNIEGDSEGCVLVGAGFGELEGGRSAIVDGSGLARFLKCVGAREEFKLEVEE